MLYSVTFAALRPQRQTTLRGAQSLCIILKAHSVVRSLKHAAKEHISASVHHPKLDCWIYACREWEWSIHACVWVHLLIVHMLNIRHCCSKYCRINESTWRTLKMHTEKKKKKSFIHFHDNGDVGFVLWGKLRCWDCQFLEFFSKLCLHEVSSVHEHLVCFDCKADIN